MISLGALPRRQWAVCENCESALRILWRHFGKTTSCAFLTYFLFPEPSEACAFGQARASGLRLNGAGVSPVILANRAAAFQHTFPRTG